MHKFPILVIGYSKEHDNYLYLVPFGYLRTILEDFHQYLFKGFNNTAAMGIGGGIRLCRRKCRPMLVLRRQKNCRRKVFHICGLSFQVLQCC